MAHSASAKKRIRQNETHRAHNRWRKRGIRAAIREYDELILHGSVEDTQAKLSEIFKLLDKTASQNVIHKNAAARTKSRLNARLNTKKAAA